MAHLQRKAHDRHQPEGAFALFDVVRLRERVMTDSGEGRTAGTRATIVHIYEDGELYEIEFVDPGDNATVRGSAIEAAGEDV